MKIVPRMFFIIEKMKEGEGDIIKKREKGERDKKKIDKQTLKID